MALETLNILLYTQTALSALVALLAFLRFGEREKYVRLIGLTFTLSFIVTLLAFGLYYSSYRRFINIPQSAYDLISFCLITLAFYHALNKRFGTFFLSITVGFLIFALLNLFFLQKEGITSYNKFLSSFIITCYCVFYFYRLMVELPSTHLQRMPMFWFTSAFLIYHAGTIFLFAFTSYLIDVRKEDLTTYWIFHNGLAIVELLIFLMGLSYDLSALRMKDTSTRSI
jgi:hypothetical protein